MANLPAALAQKVAESKTAGGGNWLQHGKYLFMIKNWRYQVLNDEIILTELFTVKAEKKTVFEGAKAITQEPNAVGSTCSEIANFSGAGKLSAPSNSRAVVLGLFGFKEGEVPAQTVSETLVAVTSDTQPAAGMLIGCDTFAKEIRSKKGEYITGRNWSCVDKPGFGLNAPDKVAARLAALKVGDEECVKVTLAQLAAAHGTISVVDATLPTPTNGVTAPALPSLPTAPSTPATNLSPLDKALAEGWKKHPQDPNYLYNEGLPAGQNLKTVADVMAGR